MNRAPLIAELEQRAVAAAGAVAKAGGLGFDEAVVIHSASNVLVRLDPASVVARVMTGTVALHDDPRRWLEREVSVLEFLAPSRLAVSPSPRIPPGPHQRDGLWVTFTEWIPEASPATIDDAREVGRSLRALHDELRRFGGELAGLHELSQDIKRLHGHLRPADAHQTTMIASLRARLNRLGPAVFQSRLPAQTLHGDVSLGNLLRTPGGLVWNDFEDTFHGPVHWDLASCLGSLRARRVHPRQIREMLEGYGWKNPQELTPFLVLQDVYDEIWQAYDRQRRRSQDPPGALSSPG